ncbi:MAG: hypothetical protein IBJ18_10395, partial [Phycisphaerales bacterium]|nr:hypothetical protein [Phycisphaerales bacterium]
MSEQDRKRVRELFMDLSELPAAQWRAALGAMTHEPVEVRAEVARLLELDARARGEAGGAGGGSGAGGVGGGMGNTPPFSF